MRKKRKNPYQKGVTDPSQWLQDMLNTWTEFCYVNYPLANAIADLLNENMELKASLAEKEKATQKRD